VKPRSLGRAGAWLAGVWAGAMIGVGGIAAPALFQVLPSSDAGRVAGRLFAIEATIGICLGALLVLIALQLGRARAEAGRGSRFGVELMLALGAVGCLVAGHYALQPMLEAARAGQGSLSFVSLHALSAGFFALRLTLLAVLAWRLTALPG
jgi:hypothetical protein